MPILNPKLLFRLRNRLLLQYLFSTCFIFWGNGLMALPHNLIPISDLDPTIINGKQYSFTLPSNVTGHQFLNTNEFVLGSLTIKSVVYENQLLRYDILNQQLTLNFTDPFGSKKILIVSDAWLTHFTIGEQHFELISTQEGIKKIYQIIGNKNIRVRYFWKKQLKIEPTSGKVQYKFSKQLRESYLEVNSKLIRYSGNKSFAKCFGEEHSASIAKFLKQHKIKVRNASDVTMEELLTFCKSIISK